MRGTLDDMADRVSGYQQHLRFSLRVHRMLSAAGGNSCFSPYSVASALALICQAARGRTAEQLRELVCPGEPDIAKHLELLRDASILEADKHGEQPVFAVSNALWVDDELNVHESFRTDLAGWPGAKLEHAPFSSDPERSRRMINADVAETTRELITELIPAGAVDTETVASLINALYVKAAWRNRFADDDTVEDTFHAPGGRRRVPMMSQVERLPYGAVDGWQSVALPAAGGVEATVLLPDDDLDEAEAQLDEDLLDRLLTKRRKRRIALHLPRLDVGMNISLAEPLQQLGVRDVFTKYADLTGLSGDPRVSVSNVLHESVLKLDEQGLEGAAATAVMMRLTSVDTGEPIDFRVDRPFLLLVRHASTGAIYFLTRVANPK